MRLIAAGAMRGMTVDWASCLVSRGLDGAFSRSDQCFVDPGKQRSDGSSESAPSSPAPKKYVIVDALQAYLWAYGTR